MCLWAILVRQVTDCSCVLAERLLGGAVSGTTLGARRDEWIEAEVFDGLVEGMRAACETKIVLEAHDAMVDASIHKAPAGGEGVGERPS